MQILILRTFRQYENLPISVIASSDLVAYATNDGFCVKKERYYGTTGDISSDSFNNLVYDYQKRYMAWTGE